MELLLTTNWIIDLAQVSLVCSLHVIHFANKLSQTTYMNYRKALIKWHALFNVPLISALWEIMALIGSFCKAY